MEAAQIYGLVGRNIGYSFSQKYFGDKFKRLFLNNHRYELFDIKTITEVPYILNLKNLRGFNVTIPYKEEILQYLDTLSEEAAEIGAVNTVKIMDGKATGYNTDVYGFEKTLLLHREDFHRSALILGDGGAAKAVKFVLKKHGIPFITVSRKLEINFQNLSDELVSGSDIIVQCTPVGTFPKDKDCLDFPFKALEGRHLIIDLIYNPAYTEFIKRATLKSAKCVNGYYMLEQQAEKAWEIWQS